MAIEIQSRVYCDHCPPEAPAISDPILWTASIFLALTDLSGEPIAEDNDANAPTELHLCHSHADAFVQAVDAPGRRTHFDELAHASDVAGRIAIGSTV